MAALTHRQPPRTPFHPVVSNIPSSSPAFGTPVHPLRPAILEKPASTPPPTPILPVFLPPATLRPLAFRTFTKKHNLTLTTSALQALATFIGRHCGAAWREDGLAEPVLEEVARMWKRQDGGGGDVIVDGEGEGLKGILKQLEGSMSGGRVVITRGGSSLSRQTSLVGGLGEKGMSGLQREESFGISTLNVKEEEDLEDRDARRWLKVIDTFEQPRMVFNPTKKHFEKSKSTPSLFPSPSQKTELTRQRYHIVHQRLLRNPAFASLLNSASNTTTFKLTPIANLLGRNSSSHLLLGLLSHSPTGALTIADLTGSIALDLSHAMNIDPCIEGAEPPWLCPGMIVLVDGVYEEEFNIAGGSLGSMGGIGGTIGGRFVGLSIGAPRYETRAATLGLTDTRHGAGVGGQSDLHIGGGFGWVDFLGVGSERGVGSRMRRIEQRLLHPHPHSHTLGFQNNPQLSPSQPSPAPQHQPHNSNKLLVLGEVNLDNPSTLSALRKVLTSYTTPSPQTPQQQPDPPPLAIILFGSFTTRAAMSASSTSSLSHSSNPASGTTAIPDSIAYKEAFDALAAVLADFPALIRNCTWVFVPGDNDPWPAAFSAGASVPLPRAKIPDMFTSRIKRVFAAANAEVGVNRERAGNGTGRVPGEAVFTTNPARLSLFGPSHEIVLFRDDVSARLRRNAITLKKQNSRDGTVAQCRVEERGEMDVDVAGGSDEDGDGMASHPMDIDADVPLSGATKATAASRNIPLTLLSQSHLSPFPLHTRPLHWSYAHSLSLYPLPTALVLCDSGMEAWKEVEGGVLCVNAGRLVTGEGKARGGEVQWVEMDVGSGESLVRSL